MGFLHQSDSITEMATKAGLPVTVTGLNICGVAIPDIVQILTGIYVTVMAIDKLYSLYMRYKHRNEPYEPKE